MLLQPWSRREGYGMTVYLFCDPEASTVQVVAPAISQDGTVRGKLTEFVRPGEDFLGHTYEDLMRLGHGRHELEPVPSRQSDPCGDAGRE
jgi:hypothetical protein